MEGNKELDTNVKYGDNKTLASRPVIITMNADSEDQLIGILMEKLDPFSNRCKYYNMASKLVDYIPAQYLPILGKS